MRRIIVLSMMIGMLPGVVRAQAPSAASAPDGLIPPGAVGVKWRPGHYLRTNVPGYQADDVEAFLAHPHTTGLLVQFNWKDLEKGRGEYDFSPIDAFLAQAASHGKVIQVKVQDRGFHGEKDANSPAYLAEMGLLAPMYKDPKTRQIVKGTAIKWWDPVCVGYFIDLYRAMGERYNRHPRFAGVTIGDGESALAVDKEPKTGYSEKAHKEQIIRAAREVKVAFPNTPVFTGFNWMGESSLRDIAQALHDIGGSGFIHPDTVPNMKFGFATDIEIEFAARGVPTFAQLQTPHFKDTMTEAQILEWAVNKIGAPMVSWNHYRDKRPGYVQQVVLPFLNTPAAQIIEKTRPCPAKMKPCLAADDGASQADQ